MCRLAPSKGYQAARDEVKPDGGACLIEIQALILFWAVAPYLDDAGCVKQDHLIIRLGQDAQQLVPRGLCLASDDGQLLAQHGVQQRALASIGPSNESNIACTMHVPIFILTAAQCQSSKRPSNHVGLRSYGLFVIGSQTELRYSISNDGVLIIVIPDCIWNNDNCRAQDLQVVM